MNTNIQIFNNPKFGEVRVAEVNGKTYFVGNDVAKALGYKDAKDAVSNHCRGAVIHPYPDNQGVIQNTKLITEGDIYRLTAKSQLPGAEAFESWIFDEVLPSIRKHGAYLTPVKTEELLQNPDLIIQLATNLKDERQKRELAELKNAEQQKKLEYQTPKVLFADAVATSDRSVLVSELAKIINQNGVDIGQNRLFEYLRQNKYLCIKGEYYNQPTQHAMDLGLFELKKTSITKPDGSVLVTCTTKVTGKGQIYFVNKFLNKNKV